MSLQPRHVPALVLVVIAIAWLPALGGGFVWDDQVLLIENRLLASLAHVPELFRTDLWAGTAKVEVAASGFYRPAVMLDFAIDRAVFGWWAPGWHLHSLAWHLVCVALVGRLARGLGAGPISSAVGMVVLGLHPVTVEAVAWISARNDLMAAAGTLAALVLLLPYEPSRRQLVAAGAALLFAFLSKESALLAPIAVVALRLARYRDTRPWAPWVAVGGAMLAYALLRLTADVGLPVGLDPAQAPGRVAGALACWGHDLILPVDLVPGRNLAWSLQAPYLLGALGWVLVAALIPSAGHHGRLGALLLALGLLPSLVAVAKTGEVADRYLYLPLAGVAVAAAGLVTRHVRSSAVGMGGLAAGATLAALLMSQSLPVWRDDGALWRAAVQAHPSPYTWGGLAKTLEDAGDLEGAAHAYAQATEAPRPFEEACYNVAAIHLKRGKPEMAATAGRRALGNGCPRSPELVAPTALGAAISGSWPEAEGLAREVSRDPTGLAVLVRLAAAVRRGELEPLREAQASGRGDPALLQTQVAWLLEQSGEAEAAASLRAPPEEAPEE